MSGAGSTTNVALRPWPAPAKEALSGDDLFKKVFQLTQERGHLRGTTEKSLQDEIYAGKNVTGDVMEGVEQSGKKDAPTKEDRLQEIGRQHGEMFTQIDWATFAASNALDLVTQLLSRDPSKNVEASFSHGYKQQRVPKGSFGIDKTHPPDRSKRAEEQQRKIETETRHKLVARGSRMEALEWSTNSFLNAASDLQAEVRKERRYWNEILSISQQGWSLQRFRRDSRHSPFAVRYGFPEASDHFKARGLAPLRMDRDGSIILDPALALKPKTLRVRISDNGKISGTSCLPAQGAATSVAVVKSIELARDSLFEEELYHEISLETRQLLAYGVELRNSVIHLLAPGLSHASTNRKILIDCILRDDASGAQDHSQDWLAQNVADALRLLLAHEHRMRLFRRSQLPPPLTLHKRLPPNPPLLRTLLATFSHLNAVGSLQAYLDRLETLLNSAGLGVSLQVTRETSWKNLTNIIEKSTRRDFSALDQILEVFTKPFDGLATLSLPSSNGTGSEKITIATRTYIGSPTFGAEHKLTLPPSLISVLNLAQDQKRVFKFSSTEEVKSYLDWILSLDLSHTLLSKEYAGRVVIMSKDPRVSIISRAGKERVQKDVAVQLADGKLKITVRKLDQFSGNNPVSPEQSFTWDGARGESSFREKVKTWAG